MNNKNYKFIIILIVFLVFILFLNNKKENFSNETIHPMNKYFDSVNLISIPERKERMTKLMNKLGIKANIVDATLVKDIDYEKLYKDNFYTREYYSKKNNRGRIACHLSQIKLLKKFIKSKDKTMFIFEDDLSENIDENYKEIINKSMKYIPDDWDIVFFGRCFDYCDESLKIYKNLYKTHSPKCRHAYGVTQKGARKILKYSLPMISNGDEMYAKHIKNGNIIAYGITPSIFSQNRDEYGSTLGNAVPKKSVKNNIFSKEFPPTCINMLYLSLLK